MFIVGDRRRMITCDGIVVVSQFLVEYFQPYPLALCFKGQGEGVGRGGRGRGRGRGRGIK